MPSLQMVSRNDGEPIYERVDDPFDRAMAQMEAQLEADGPDREPTPGEIRQDALDELDNFVYDNPDLAERLAPLRRRLENLY